MLVEIIPVELDEMTISRIDASKYSYVAPVAISHSLVGVFSKSRAG